MADSFSLKTIQLCLSLNSGEFEGAGSTKIIEGLACEVTVNKPGLPQKNSADVKVWGLKYEDMAQLTMLAFRPLESQHNLISIKAGEQGGALSLVFHGEISKAYADFNQAPDPCMCFQAESGNFPQRTVEPSTTIDGESSAARLFSQFAQAAGYALRNEGVNSTVRNACFLGSPMEKILKLASQVDCDLIVDDNEIIVMPKGQARDDSTVFLSKDSGLLAYPTFTQHGISCRCLYNPALTYGGLIQVESIVPRAQGLWRINSLSHRLSAYTSRGGNWESQIEAEYYE